MPRFGLPRYVQRWVTPHSITALGMFGEMRMPVAVHHGQLARLPRVNVEADFHCVTTWSVSGLSWEGVRFSDFWTHFVSEWADSRVSHVVFSGADGFSSCIPLDELLKPTTLLATHLNGEVLSVKHGGPLRVVVPQLYGYKNIKHVRTLELCTHARPDKGGRLLVHPRGHVDLEERSGSGFQTFWRALYRLQVPRFLRQVEHLQVPPSAIKE